MNKGTLKKILAAALFGVAFGYMEAAVVVYLRQIYYPEGFVIPFYPYLFYFAQAKMIRSALGADYLIEVGREISTLVALFALAYLSGRNWREKIAVLLLAWGAWDIFYYVFLFLLIGWPGSLLTMDILFLIPVPWLAPVIVPVIASLIMIAASLLLFV